MDDELYHYGVKGMKWGIRRTPAQLGPKNNKKNDKARDKAERKKRKGDMKNRRTLSDTDLNKKIARLKAEKQLKELTESDIAPGRTATKKFLLSTGSKVLSAAAVGGLAYAGHYAMTHDFDPLTAANYIFPNPNKKK